MPNSFVYSPGFSPCCKSGRKSVNFIFLNEVRIIGKQYLKPLVIGRLQTRHNLVLAPLAGISDYPFRQLCREYGADLTFTEMVSVDGLLYRNAATRRLLEVKPRERPIGFQFFGSDGQLFEQVLPQIHSMQPDVIDLNFGCPVRKVVNKGAGAALLRDLNRMQRMVEIVAGLTHIPVTAKIRIGWDWNSVVVEDAARAVEAGGAMAVTVHARTRSQGYAGEARWEFIAQAKQAVGIPVIGNGDVFDGPAALRMFRATGVDGIMLARGALGRPWIFREIINYLSGHTHWQEPDPVTRLKVLTRHYRMEVEQFGEEVALSRMKKHFVWYTKGLPHIARLRDQIFRVRDYAEIQEIFSRYLEQYSRFLQRDGRFLSHG